MPPILPILLGGLLISLGINFFLSPHRLLDGGIIGLALIMRYLWGLKTGFSVFLLSVPIYLFVGKMNRRLLFNSLVGLSVSSLMIDSLSPFRSGFHLPMFPSAMMGGLLVGTGVGIMLRHGTSTGGTDLIAQYVSERTGWNAGVLIFLVDALVIACGSPILDSQRLLHTLLTISAVGFATSVCVSAGKTDGRKG
ncbi:MAG: YitT family protein [Planifilum sp.]